jgi:hypothetical protein
VITLAARFCSFWSCQNSATVSFICHRLMIFYRWKRLLRNFELSEIFYICSVFMVLSTLCVSYTKTYLSELQRKGIIRLWAVVSKSSRGVKIFSPIETGILHLRPITWTIQSIISKVPKNSTCSFLRNWLHAKHIAFYTSGRVLHSIKRTGNNR